MKKEKKNSTVFELVTIEKTYTIQTDTLEEFTEWIQKLQDGILSQLNSVTSSKELVSLKRNESVLM